MAKDPFKLTAVEEAVRRARSPLFEELRKNAALGFADQAQRQALLQASNYNSPTMKIARELSESMAQVSKRHQEIFAPLSKQLAASIQLSDLVKGIQQSMGGGVLEQFIKQQRQYEEALRPFRDMASQVARQQRAFTEAMGGIDMKRWSEMTKSLTAAIGAHVEAGTLATASEVARGLATSLSTIEVDAPPDPAAAVVLFNALRFVLEQLASAKDGLPKVPLMDLMAAIAFFLALNDFFNPPYTDADRAVAAQKLQQTKETRELLERAEERAATAAQAQVSMEQLLEQLPRAVITGAGRVRAEPARASKFITKLPKDTVVAVLQRSDSWLEVMYSDPLTLSRERGWVFGTSLKLPPSNKGDKDRLK